MLLKKISLKKTLWVLVGGLTAAVATGGRAQTGGEIVDGVAALVNEHIITVSDVRDYSSAAERPAAAAYGSDSQELRKKLLEIRRDALNTLIERALILDAFKKKEYQIPEHYIESQVRDTITSEFGGSRIAFMKNLRAQGMTLDAYRKQIRERIIVSSMSRNAVSAEVVVSPYKLEQYYKANFEKFRMEDSVRLRMILLRKEGLTPEQLETKRAMANEIKEKLDNGGVFASMARLYSEQPQRETGGDWGWVDRKTLRDELRDVAFSMKAGEHSAVIETKEGFYILLVEESKVAHTQPLEEVRDKIDRILEQEERARLQKQWLEKLKKGAFIRKFPPFDEAEPERS